ncbi:MAG: calcium-binding protein [Pseudomonadota bacterium]
MMEITVYDAAGDYMGGLYPVDTLETGKTSKEQIVLEGEVTSGEYKGESYSEIWRGSFNQDGDFYKYIEDIRYYIGGELFLRFGFDGRVRSDEEMSDQFESGIRYVGNAFNNFLLGTGRADLIKGGRGNDTIDGGEGGYTDRLFGDDGRDQLIGGAGHDMLDGGSGRDIMMGGRGDDSYIVDNASDLVTEATGQGEDSVKSYLTYTLPENVENLELSGKLAGSGFGNSRPNEIIGSGQGNYLSGEGGKDTLFGEKGDDTLEGGKGGDALLGGEGDDTLDGGKGGDSLRGGEGDDVYYINDLDDYVFDLGGFDTVYSKVSISFWEAASVTGVELLILTGKSDLWVEGEQAAEKIVGNEGNNKLFGGAGEDTLVGGAGDDRLDGGRHVDTLRGGEGDDTLLGADARDELRGGSGTDQLKTAKGLAQNWMKGGAGEDLFVFRAYDTLSENKKAIAVIADFQPGLDQLDLSKVHKHSDWNSSDERFTFIGSDKFSGAGNELRYANDLLRADITGDGETDFTIKIANGAVLTEADFIL